jgi:hypothetical protein
MTDPPQLQPYTPDGEAAVLRVSQCPLSHTSTWFMIYSTLA